MAVVAGVDFGTLSVRVTLVDDRERPRSALRRPSTRFTASATNPDYATQAMPTT